MGHRPDDGDDGRGTGRRLHRRRSLLNRVRRHPCQPQRHPFEALEQIRQGVRQRFGGFDRDIAAGLAVRHDHGSQYVAHDFQNELAFLGIASSPAFIRAPEGPFSCADITPWDRAEPDGCAERFIRTLKENLLWLRGFDTVEALRQAVLAFKERYNQDWIVERHGYRTPAQVRAEQLQPAALAA